MVRHPFVDLPDGSTIQIVDSAPILKFLVIPKQQSGSRVLYGIYTDYALARIRTLEKAVRMPTFL